MYTACSYCSCTRIAYTLLILVPVPILQSGMKPLIIACMEGFERLVDLLLLNNADINILDHVRYYIYAYSVVMCM